MDPCSEEFDDFDDFLTCFHDCDPEVTECMDENCPGGVSVTVDGSADEKTMNNMIIHPFTKPSRESIFLS